ncbi:MAG: ATP-binding protein, partial [Candidatus Deferrimicrobiaceae bacterium]
MRWKNSLAIPIVALLLAVAIGMLLIGYVINNRVFYTALEGREKDKTNSIRFATLTIIDSEVRKLTTLSNLLNTDGKITAGLIHYQRTGGDFRPLKSAMDNLFTQIDTKIFVVTDPAGTVLYRANEPLRRGDRHRVWGVEEAAAGTSIIAASEGPGGWAIRALAPIRAGKRVIGILILGTRIDGELAGKISRETGARISFANLNGVLTGSSLPEGKPRFDPLIVREVLFRSYPIFRMDMDGYRAVQYTPLKVVDEMFCLIIETDMGVVRGMLLRNRVKLAKTGALILAGVLLLGITVTMLLVRPVKKLEREAREVVRAFTGEELPMETGGNEIDTLAAANRRMVETIRHHIAGREKAEAALRKTLEQERQSQKMEAVGRLAGGVAHDFNNLLTVINGYSEVLLRRFGETDPARREVGEIHKAGERAAALTRQLLAFSRKQMMDSKPIRLNEIVSGMVAMLRRLIGENVALATSLAPEPWIVVADPGQVEQVVLNLAVNARDAMPSGGTITISTENVALVAPEDRDGYVLPAGRYVRLGVADTGCGMDVETMSHMFDPFFTTKERGKGTGLGLASVYGIVKQSGAFISARSATGRG